MPAGTQAPIQHAGIEARQTRLPWWAIALPCAAFAVLLMLIVGAPEARAATGGLSSFAEFLEYLRDILLRSAD